MIRQRPARNKRPDDHAICDTAGEVRPSDPLATLFCQAIFWADRISTSPPEHDNGRDRGGQLVRSVIKDFNYPGRAVVLRWYASGVSTGRGS